jgi:hypothetical protein
VRKSRAAKLILDNAGNVTVTELVVSRSVSPEGVDSAYHINEFLADGSYRGSNFFVGRSAVRPLLYVGEWAGTIERNPAGHAQIAVGRAFTDPTGRRCFTRFVGSFGPVPPGL